MPHTVFTVTKRGGAKWNISTPYPCLKPVSLELYLPILLLSMCYLIFRLTSFGWPRSITPAPCISWQYDFSCKPFLITPTFSGRQLGRKTRTGCTWSCSVTGVFNVPMLHILCALLYCEVWMHQRLHMRLSGSIPILKHFCLYSLMHVSVNLYNYNCQTFVCPASCYPVSPKWRVVGINGRFTGENISHR
jgi:hypothetical protein